MELSKMTLGFNNFNMLNMLSMGSMMNMGSSFSSFGSFGSMFNPFGSIFGYGNFTTGCGSTTSNCGNNWGQGAGAMLGLSIGMMALPLLFKAGESVVGDIKKSSNKYQQEQTSTSLDDLKDDLEAEYQKLGVSNIEDARNYKIEEDAKYTAHEAARTELSKLKQEGRLAETALSNATDARETAQTAYSNAQQATINAKKALDAAEADDPNKSNLETAYNNAVEAEKRAKADLAAKEKAERAASDALDDKNEEIKAQEKTVEEAKKALDAREIEVTKAQEKIEELYKKVTTEQNKLDGLKLDKADGNLFNRTTTKSFEKVYDIEKGDYKTEKSGKDISKADVRYLIGQYSATTDKDVKLKYAKAIYKILNDTTVSENVKKAFSGTIEIIKRDFPNETFKA